MWGRFVIQKPVVSLLLLLLLLHRGLFQCSVNKIVYTPSQLKYVSVYVLDFLHFMLLLLLPHYN